MDLTLNPTGPRMGRGPSPTYWRNTMAQEINEQTLQAIVELNRAARLSYGGKGKVSEHLAWVDELRPLVKAAWSSDAPAPCKGMIAEIDYTSTAIRIELRDLDDGTDSELDLTLPVRHIKDCAMRMSAEALDYMAGI